MVIKNINEILAKMNTKVSNSITTIKSNEYKEKYGGLAKQFYDYSKRVLQLEGIISTESTAEPSATDIMLAKCIVNDVKGGGWEGSGQAIMKMISIMLGRNLESKEVCESRINLPKGTIIKTTTGTIGIITEQSNLFTIKKGSLTKDTSFRNNTSQIEMATEEEITLFAGSIMESTAMLRSFSSAFKVATLEEIQDMIAISNHGIDIEKSHTMEYKKFMVGINPELSQGKTA